MEAIEKTIIILENEKRKPTRVGGTGTFSNPFFLNVSTDRVSRAAKRVRALGVQELEK